MPLWKIACTMLLCGVAGCNQAASTASRFVTRADLDDALASIYPEARSDAQRILAATKPSDRKPQLEQMIELASASPDHDARVSDALAASDLVSTELADTIRAIDAATQIVVHNMANADTTGFKTTRAVMAAGRTVRAQLDLEEGPIVCTNRSLDLAIQGAGFLRVKKDREVGYTRNGNLMLNAEGILAVAVADGYRLDPPISVPLNTTDICIAQDGQVTATIARSATKRTVGTIRLSDFVNGEALRASDDGLLHETPESGPPVVATGNDEARGQLLQGYLEQSNVNLIHERLRLQFLRNWKQTLMLAANERPRSSGG